MTENLNNELADEITKLLTSISKVADAVEGQLPGMGKQVRESGEKIKGYVQVLATPKPTDDIIPIEDLIKAQAMKDENLLALAKQSSIQTFKALDTVVTAMNTTSLPPDSASLATFIALSNHVIGLLSILEKNDGNK